MSPTNTPRRPDRAPVHFTRQRRRELMGMAPLRVTRAPEHACRTEEGAPARPGYAQATTRIAADPVASLHAQEATGSSS